MWGIQYVAFIGLYHLSLDLKICLHTSNLDPNSAHTEPKDK